MAKEQNESTIYIYDAASRWRFQARWQEILRYSYLLQNLVSRDVKARYKNSVLGVLWNLLNPLGLMLVFTILFSVLSGDSAPRQYPVFILVGLVPWRFFAGTLTTSSMAIINHSSLVKKVYFPRELLPISALLTEFVNFIFGFLILIVFLYIYGIGITIHALWLPFIVLTQMILMLGIGFILSTLTVFYRDVLMILDVALQALFFLSPVFYSFETLFGPSSTLWGITFDPTQAMRWINPIASIIDGYRAVLWGTMGSSGPVSMDPKYLIRTLVESLIILVIGYYLFARREHLFGEKL